MTHRLFGAAAAFAATFAIASQTEAAVAVSASGADTPLAAGQQLVLDFDGLIAPGYTLTLGGPAGIFDGSLGLVPGVAAPPPGTTSDYLAIQQGGSATLLTPLLSQISIYIGSPDAYNSIRFIGLNGFDQTLNGVQLAGGAFNGDQSIGRRMTYSFGADRINQVIFSSSGNSFEFDNIAAASAIPEPAAWLLMIAGFSLAGAVIRSRRWRPTIVGGGYSPTAA